MANLSLKTRIDQFNNISNNGANIAGRLLVETMKHAGEHGDRTLTQRLIANAKPANAKRFVQFLEVFGCKVTKDGQIDGLRKGFNGNAEFAKFDKLMQDGKGWTSKEVKAAFPEIFPAAKEVKSAGEEQAEQNNLDLAKSAVVEPVPAMDKIKELIQALDIADQGELSRWLVQLTVNDVQEDIAA